MQERFESVISSFGRVPTVEFKDKFDLQRKAAAGKSFKNIDFAGSGERRRVAILKTSSSSPQILSVSVNVRKEIFGGNGLAIPRRSMDVPGA